MNRPVYDAFMAETKPIPVRLSAEMIDRLDRAATKAHLSNRSEVIKLCISSFLEYFEGNGVAALPLDWKEMLRDLDGRTRSHPKGIDVAGNEPALKGTGRIPGYVTKPEMSLAEERTQRDAKKNADR